MNAARQLAEAPLVKGQVPSIKEAVALLLEECKEANWDGYGAAPVSRAAAEHALRFFSRLSANIPIPEVSGDPEGGVILEWNRDDRTFLIAFDAGKIFYFAGIIGDRKFSGKNSMTGRIPREVVEYIQEVFC